MKCFKSPLVHLTVVTVVIAREIVLRYIARETSISGPHPLTSATYLLQSIIVQLMRKI